MRATVFLGVMLMTVAQAGCKKSSPPPATSAPAPKAAPAPAATAPSAQEPAAAPGLLEPDKVTRMSPADVHREVKEAGAMLVCAYPDPAKFAAMKLHGAMARDSFEAKLTELPRDSRLIFYCA